MRSRAPPVAKVSFPESSTVTAESLASIMPAANGCPGLLQQRNYKTSEGSQGKNIDIVGCSPFDILVSNVDIGNGQLDIPNNSADQ